MCSKVEGIQLKFKIAGINSVHLGKATFDLPSVSARGLSMSVRGETVLFWNCLHRSPCCVMFANCDGGAGFHYFWTSTGSWTM
eukprot:269922-Amphidinium_carterae.1